MRLESPAGICALGQTIMITERTPYEAAAKAALLNWLAATNALPLDAAIISELELRTSGRRADLVVTHPMLTAFEVKTHADTLLRLPEQLETFCRAFPLVYAVVATRHLPRVRKILPKWCGLIEIAGDALNPKIRRLRKASASPILTMDAQASALSIKELKRAFRDMGGFSSQSSRRELIASNHQVSPKNFNRQLQATLSARYRETSEEFLKLIEKREVVASDLKLLRMWGERSQSKSSTDPDVAFFQWLQGHAADSVIGEVPDDIAQMFRKYAA